MSPVTNTVSIPVTATSIFGDKAPPPKKENPTLQLFTTEVNSTIGRHMVASEDIRAGTVIMRKKPLVLGPKLASEPVCLGCHQKLDFLYEECSRCGWPLCCQECENSKLHRDECEVFKRSGYKPNIESLQERQLAYTAVTPLRCLLLKTTAPSKYEELTSFQSHLEEHTKTPLYHILKRRLLPFFNAALKFPVAQEELLTVYSILDTNSFEIRDVRGKINIRGLYTAANLLTHRCKHNTKHSFHGEDLEMVVTATVPVKKGGLIAATYTQTLWGTLSRRRHLKRSKHFDCGCGRCRDPTEFGTYAGSMYCSQCRRDDRRDCCPKMVSEDPLDEDAMWRCERCEHVISGRQMAWNNDAMREGIKDLERYPWEFERFLEIHEDQLHPTNCHALDVKYALTQMYSEMMTGQRKPPKQIAPN